VSGLAARLVDRIVEAAVTRAAAVRRRPIRPGGSALLNAMGAFFPFTTARVLAQTVPPEHEGA